MNSYGHPQGPEVAMLAELHALWGRVFGGAAASRPVRALLIAAVLVGGVAVAWGVV